MNRAQRRAQEKVARRRRAASLGRDGVDRYVSRARRKMAGMVFRGIPAGDELHGRWSFPAMTAASDRKALEEYAEAAPHRWHLRVSVRFVAGNDAYIEEVEGEVGQALLIGELVEEWKRMLAEARGRGNPRHLDSEMVEIRLATNKTGEEYE